MKMDMEHRLPGIGICVCYDTKPALGNSALTGNHCGNSMKMADQSIIFRQKVKSVDNMFPGNQQQVQRCGRVISSITTR